MTEAQFPFTTDALLSTARQELQLAALHSHTNRCLRLQALDALACIRSLRP